MNWRITLSDQAQTDLGGLDRVVRRRIQAYLIERVAAAPNPRRIGAPLSGERFRQLWRYRVGDYRIIAEIKDAEIMIFVVEIGHRRDIYR